MERAKRLYLNEEGDNWFERNEKSLLQLENKATTGVQILYEFLQKQRELYFPKGKVLEVGSSFGYNLKFLKEKMNYDCYGVEPSKKAVEFGNERYPGIKLLQGTADELKFEDSFFDIVILGFCMYQVDRKLLAKVIEEVDRVLKEEGLLVITDFETPMAFKRKNIHNIETPTYKCDYVKIFCSSLGYSLIEKKVFSHKEECFCKDIQERISTQILYKEPEINLYTEDGK